MMAVLWLMSALRSKEYPRTEGGLEQMALAILVLGEYTRVVMETTGRYHEPVAVALHEYDTRVTVMNLLFSKQSRVVELPSARSRLTRWTP